MAKRTNDQWMADLGTNGAAYDVALADLREVILSGLPYALSSWLPANSPQTEALYEEVTQETLLKVLSRLDSFQGRSQFTTWVYKIASRTALTELRRRRWKDVSLEDLLENEEAPASPRIAQAPDPSPEVMAEQADVLRRLQGMMQEELTEKQRLAITILSVHGLPMEEAARRMGMERNALYKLLHDARLRLKRRLARDGLSPGEILAMFEGP